MTMKLIDRFKGIFPSKSKMQNAAEEKKTEEEKKIEDKDIIISVPEPEKTESPVPVLTDKHNTFNEIVKSKESDLYFRLMSGNSSEIFRMNCSWYRYKFGDLRIDMPPEARRRFEYEIPYLKSENRWHFIARVFVTAKKRYFYQLIRPDETCGFKLVDEQWLQKIMTECECECLNNGRVFYENNNDVIKWVSEPGKFTIDKFDRMTCKRNNIHLIDGYEIINKQLYNDIIEVF